MPLMDEFKEERARMKERPFKDRFQYFLDYYKWHVVIIACVLYFIGSMAYNIITAKDTALRVALIDCNSNEATVQEYNNEIIEHLNINPKTHQIFLDNSYFLSGLDTMSGSSAEVLSVHIMAQEIDVFLSPEDVFNRYVQNGIFHDLRTILPEEYLEYYKDSFYYVEQSVIDDEEIYNIDHAETPFVDNADHSAPETMENPIPVGIYVTGCEDFQGHYYFQRETQEVVFGLLGNVTDPTYAIQFLDIMVGRAE